MIAVSLDKLLTLNDSRDVWPEEFDRFIKSLEEAPGDRAGWAALADWLKGHDEEQMGAAAHWISKRDVVVEKKVYGRWEFDNSTLPSFVRYSIPHEADHKTLAGLVSDLGRALQQLRDQLV